MTDYSPLDDAMLDEQAVLLEPAEDRRATITLETWAGALLLAQTRAAYFGDRQRVRQLRDFRGLPGLRLAIAWSVSAA